MTGALSAAQRSYPTCEVRGRSQEDPIPNGQQPRGFTPCPRSGAAAESARLQWRRNGREELPCVPGQGRWLKGATPRPKPEAVAGRSHTAPEARAGGREEQPNIQGLLAVQAQEGQEELSHAEGQEAGR